MRIVYLNQRIQRNQILFQYLRDRKKKRKKKKGAQKKGGRGGGGENSPISPPLDPRLYYRWRSSDLAYTHSICYFDDSNLSSSSIHNFHDLVCRCKLQIGNFLIHFSNNVNKLSTGNNFGTGITVIPFLEITLV